MAAPPRREGALELVPGVHVVDEHVVEDVARGVEVVDEAAGQRQALELRPRLRHPNRSGRHKVKVESIFFALKANA